MNSKNQILKVMKDDLLKIIIQELRSPITAIIGFTEILKESENKKDYNLILETISDASKKTKELLDLALMVSEIDTIRNDELVRPYKLSCLFDIVINDLKSDIRKKKINLVPPDHVEISEIIINPDLIKQVIQIILQWAIKFSPERSTIRILLNENIDHIEMEIKFGCNEKGKTSVETVKQFLLKETLRRNQWPGLEIAITKYIADLHHAKIEILDYPDGEVSAKLFFPVNSAKGEALHQLLSQMN
jgi:K+-sensing histidine kinase KdpD